MDHSRDPISPRQVQMLQEMARDLSFGTISLVFQNGKLIQMEKHEKIRLDRTSDS